MAKVRIIDIIPDLIVECALTAPSYSVRQFLLEVKGLTNRQYKYVMARAPIVEWRYRREELQNQITAQKISRLIDDAAQLNAQFIKASRFYVAKFGNTVWVLHSFIKKARKTPKTDLEIGMKRYKELLKRIERG